MTVSRTTLVEEKKHSSPDMKEIKSSQIIAETLLTSSSRELKAALNLDCDLKPSTTATAEHKTTALLSSQPIRGAEVIRVQDFPITIKMGSDCVIHFDFNEHFALDAVDLQTLLYDLNDINENNVLRIYAELKKTLLEFQTPQKTPDPLAHETHLISVNPHCSTLHAITFIFYSIKILKEFSHRLNELEPTAGNVDEYIIFLYELGLAYINATPKLHLCKIMFEANFFLEHINAGRLADAEILLNKMNCHKDNYPEIILYCSTQLPKEIITSAEQPRRNEIEEEEILRAEIKKLRSLYLSHYKSPFQQEKKDAIRDSLQESQFKLETISRAIAALIWQLKQIKLTMNPQQEITINEEIDTLIEENQVNKTYEKLINEKTIGNRAAISDNTLDILCNQANPFINETPVSFQKKELEFFEYAIRSNRYEDDASRHKSQFSAFFLDNMTYLQYKFRQSSLASHGVNHEVPHSFASCLGAFSATYLSQYSLEDIKLLYVLKILANQACMDTIQEFIHRLPDYLTNGNPSFKISESSTFTFRIFSKDINIIWDSVGTPPQDQIDAFNQEYSDRNITLTRNRNSTLTLAISRDTILSYRFFSTLPDTRLKQLNAQLLQLGQFHQATNELILSYLISDNSIITSSDPAKFYFARYKSIDRPCSTEENHLAIYQNAINNYMSLGPNPKRWYERVRQQLMRQHIEATDSLIRQNLIYFYRLFQKAYMVQIYHLAKKHSSLPSLGPIVRYMESELANLKIPGVNLIAEREQSEKLLKIMFKTTANSADLVDESKLAADEDYDNDNGWDDLEINETETANEENADDVDWGDDEIATELPETPKKSNGRSSALFQPKPNAGLAATPSKALAENKQNRL